MRQAQAPATSPGTRGGGDIDRRGLVLGATAGSALMALFGLVSGAGAQDRPAGAATPAPAATPGAPAAAPAQAGTSDIETTLKKILGEAKPTEGKLVLDMPEIAENGNTVPYTLSIESPMTEQDHVKALHVLAAGNPQPGVASFQLSPDSGRAFASSRMRLARTQDVVAVAEMSDGRFHIARRAVKVTIGGCGG